MTPQPRETQILPAAAPVAAPKIRTVIAAPALTPTPANDTGESRPGILASRRRRRARLWAR